MTFWSLAKRVVKSSKWVIKEQLLHLVSFKVFFLGLIFFPCGSGKMAGQLRAFATPAEDPGFIPITHKGS